MQDDDANPELHEDPDAPSDAGAEDAAPEPETTDRAAGELETVRSLLLGPEWERVVDARRRFDDPTSHAAEVAKALPAAVAIRAAQDEALGAALAPTIEDSLRTSVRKHPQAIVDAIFPVMGPAIRRSVADTFLRAIQGLNEALEQSLTLKGLGWRIESWRTGRPFAEVVLLHTLAFRVEQVFLIHRETGLLLQHLQADSVAGQDPDMVSGMLTAIQDFVKDSFKAGGNESLNSMRVGTMTVWIEHSPHAILATAIRGTPPQSLRAVMQESLERVSLQMADSLEDFQGDASVFAACRPELEPVLVEQRRDGKARSKRRTLLAWLLIGIVLGLLAWWAVASYVLRRDFAAFVRAVEQQPGILVTRTDKIDGVYQVYGLRDPFAQDPTALKEYELLGPARVHVRMEQHQSSEPAFVLYKSRNILKPPQGVTIDFDSGVLKAKGSTSNKWLAFARARALLIPGVTQFNDDAVVNTTLPALTDLKAKIEARKPRFIVNTTDLSPGQDGMFRDLVKDIRSLVKLAEEESVSLRVELMGHTDSTGAEAKNMRLSMQRAQQVAAVLVSAGVNNDYLTPLGVGATDPVVAAEGTDKDREANRRVNIRVVLPR
ncbi:MAG: OmpA family protein [Planctomycetes bacterium]|nr:OmpA family protein [Planctomycetota bacterium]